MARPRRSATVRWQPRSSGFPKPTSTTALGSGQSLAAVAKAHNVDPQKVIDALVADARSELAAAVTSGKLTQVQADQATTKLTERITDQVNGVGRHAGGGGAAGGGPGRGPRQQESVSDLSVAAKVIGIPESDLTTAVNSGQSLAAVAQGA